jgi:hypothetical protein
MALSLSGSQSLLLLETKSAFVLHAGQRTVNELIKIPSAESDLARHCSQQRIADVAATALVTQSRSDIRAEASGSFVNQKYMVSFALLYKALALQAA